MKITEFVLEENIISLEKMIDKMNKRAKKLEVAPFILERTGEIEEEKIKDEIQMPDGSWIRQEFLIRRVEYNLIGEEIKLNGWRFIAAIDHQNYPIYNVVKNLSDVNINEYRDSKPSCEHCKHKRLRKNTFIVYNEDTKETLQVGSTCIRDFTGHGKAESILKMFDSVRTFFCQSSEKNNEIRYDPRIPTDEYVRIVAELILRDGFLSKKRCQDYEWPTSSYAFDMYIDWPRGSKNKFFKTSLTDEGKKLADYTLNEYLTALNSIENPNDFELNTRNFLNDSSFQQRYRGFVAAGVNSALNLMKKVDEKAKEKCPNKFVGIIGERIEIPVRVQYGKSFSSRYGGGTRYVMRTIEGNRLTWFTSGSINLQDNEEVVLKFRVKDHQTYEGMNSTLITRATVVN